MPPMKVPTPVIEPRTTGWPRPVSSPVSERPSEYAMLIPAAIAVADAGDEGVCGLCVESATAKIGASVDSEPSISPVMAGWTRWRRNSWFGLMSRVYQSSRKLVEHKADLTNAVRAA